MTAFFPSISNTASASDTDGFNPGYIISDPVFTNSGSMSAAQIQDFLNSQNSVCLKNFQTLSLNDQNGDGLGDEPYGKGVNEYVSAATVIWQAAQLYKINPQVILATLQKEQGLITRTDCPDWRYNTALGYGCPDSQPCSTAAYGFTRQIDYGTWHFRGFFDDGYPIPPITPGSRFIAYNPDSSCGGTTVNIQNKATAALYSYTPYQPNAATLAAAMGQTVTCGAYGNINFWRYFTMWFGSTTDPRLNFSLIKSSNSPAVYLQTSAGKYYIPSGDVMTAWGLDTLPVQTVTQSYIDSLATGPWVSNILKDDWNNYFVVENKTIHYVRDASYLNLLNIKASDAVQSLGITYSLKSGNWVGRFVADQAQPNTIWLLDKGTRHAISGNDMLYEWGYTPDQLMQVSTTFLNTLTLSPNAVTQYAQVGGNNYVVDTGRLVTLSSTPLQTAFTKSGATNVSYDSSTLAFLRQEQGSKFVINASTGQWFMLEGGKFHYIKNSQMAELWGKTSSTPMNSMSGYFMSQLQNGGDLTYLVQDSSSSYWIIDGNKRYIPTSSVAESWLGQGVSPPRYSDDSIASMARASDATININATGSQYNYTLLNGTKHYLSTNAARSIWNAPTTQLSPQLVNNIPESSYLDSTVQDTNGQGYLIMGGIKYPIDSGFNSDWNITTNTPTISAALLNTYAPGATLKSFITIGTTPYVISNGQKVSLKQYSDAYNTSSLGSVTLPQDYITSGGNASYLVKSTNPSDTTVWLVTGGKKSVITFAQQVSLGYLSRGVIITPLSPETLSLIPDSNSPVSFLIQKQNSGIKLLNFGSSLGFPDGDTLNSYIGTTGVTIVADSIFDSIPLTGNVSRVITDDQGKYYVVSGGIRHWLTNYTAYLPYVNIPRVYVYGTTHALIPEGAAY